MNSSVSAERILFIADVHQTVHDFYAEQPVKGATIYLLRAIIHDWSDKYCLRILRRLREAAAPTSRLVVVDTILPYACAEDGVSSIPGAEKPRLPAPLLPNGGHANIIPYMMDLQVRCCPCGLGRRAAH